VIDIFDTYYALEHV